MLIIAPNLVAFLSVVVDAHAMAFWPFILARSPLSPVGENHERIHLAQQAELLLVGFYVLYVLDYFRNRLDGYGPTEAYFGIRFEQEAFARQDDLGYLETRERFAWLSYERG